MERGLLSDPKLAAFYDRVVWMYLFQDFSHSDSDRAAERVAIRFGITSWPQHFLVDPYSLEVLADVGRSLASFRVAVDRTSVKRRQGGITPAELVSRDAAARKLESPVSIAIARKQLAHRDVVVRFRAIERLRKADPEGIVQAARWLLVVPHDQIRFAVCQTIARLGADQATAKVLEALVERPAGSRNPKRLADPGRAGARQLWRPARGRSRRTACDGWPLLQRADPRSGGLPWLRSHSERRVRRSPLRGTCARRLPMVKPNLKGRELRACTGLARHVHSALAKLMGKTLPFPGKYHSAARTALIDGWKRQVRSPR